MTDYLVEETRDLRPLRRFTPILPDIFAVQYTGTEESKDFFKERFNAEEAGDPRFDRITIKTNTNTLFVYPEYWILINKGHVTMETDEYFKGRYREAGV